MPKPKQTIPNVDQYFGQTLRQYRENLGLTGYALAEKLDVNPSFVCNIERGRDIVSPEAALRMSVALGDLDCVLVRQAVKDYFVRFGKTVDTKEAV